jgi:hypothetical protein
VKQGHDIVEGLRRDLGFEVIHKSLDLEEVDLGEFRGRLQQANERSLHISKAWNQRREG